ncbi:MAG TPA: DUF4369 domain-containing protein, partial [Bacteroidales bacterium]
MKKVIYLFIFCIIISSCTSKPHYVVKGKITGSDSIIFYLQKREGGKIVSIDSAISRKGAFTMKNGSVEYPQMIQLVAGKTRKRTSFYIDNSEITVTGNLDSLYKAKVTGSRTQDEYSALIESNKPLSDIYSKSIIKYQAASMAGDKANISILEKQADSIQNEMINLQKNFVKNNPSSYVSPSILV